MIYCLREDKFADDLHRITEYRRHGSKLFVFGAKPLLAAANVKGLECEGRIEVPVGSHIVPTYELGAVGTLWPWIGEFVAACTRRGKMPVMFQSFDVPGGRDRAKRYEVKSDHGSYAKWHAETPPPVKPGELGRAWLREIRHALAAIRRDEMADIREAGRRAAATRARGGQAWVIATGHATACLFGVPHDPGYFRKIESPAALTTNDFVLGVGYSSIFNEPEDRHFADSVRQAGASAAWIAARYRPERVRTLPGEVFIDAHWKAGDAVVEVPGYDIKILPPSGYLVSAIYFMINAEMTGQE